jgi:hypothetical protein
MLTQVWFTSTESFAKVLSAGNRDLLRVIVEQAPGSLDVIESARESGDIEFINSPTDGPGVRIRTVSTRSE